MKNLLAALAFLTVSALGAFAFSCPGEMSMSDSMDKMTKEQKTSMAKMHREFADCLEKGEKKISECHEPLMKAMHEAMGGGESCKGHGKAHDMGHGKGHDKEACTSKNGKCEHHEQDKDEEKK